MKSAIVAGWAPAWTLQFKEQLIRLFPQSGEGIQEVNHVTDGHTYRTARLSALLEVYILKKPEWSGVFINTDFGFETIDSSIHYIRKHPIYYKTPIVVVHGGGVPELQEARKLADIVRILDSDKIDDTLLRNYLSNVLPTQAA